MGALLGDELPAFLGALREPPARGLRINPAKVGADDLAAVLGVELTPAPWGDGTGFVLPPDAPPLGLHPAIDCGLFYLQDPASMLAPAMLAPQPGWRVLDAAAAPGGKATDLAARVGAGGALLANEVVRSRLHVLEQALDRWGSPAAMTASLALERLAGAWDGVLLDAPCTGEALLRRDPAAERELGEASVRGNAKRQARLLDAVAPLVRPGGVLLYSTCSFETAENEEQVERFLDRHDGWEIDRCERVWPHRDPGDGQFAARLIRTGDGPAREWPYKPAYPRSRAALAAWREFRERSLPGFVVDEDAIVAAEDRVYLSPDPDLPVLARPGLPLGRLRPGRFEPAHALATAVDPEHAAERVAWSPEYLHGEALPSHGPDGWVLVTYERWGLGWARRSRGMLKNFFPKAFRRVG
jgi:16S rRNA C967 or C1407 C5-methylase (RsmB/RsmF family)/NOL1/NOP2/fmu family ribosome biogenesis protein